MRFVPGENTSALVAQVHESPNFEARRHNAKADMLLLHYTGMLSAEKAIEWLAAPESKVSCHYVVDTEGTITAMVAEPMRAWHAGVAHWRGVDDINSCSIGIEIHNSGHGFGYPDFPQTQISAVEALARDIMTRHQILPHRVLAHSDVAPRRKKDPGEKFPWARLAEVGIGHYYQTSDMRLPVPGLEAHNEQAFDILSPGDRGLAILRLQRQLRSYGYWIEPSGVFDEHTELVVIAFQRHFRPLRVDGRADKETVDVLDGLLASLSAV